MDLWAGRRWLGAMGGGVAALACGGGPAEAPPEAPGPPPGWTAATVPAAQRLGDRDLRCALSPSAITWHQDGTFLVSRPDAKFGGTWRVLDGDIVYVTPGPLTRCTAARFLLDEQGEPHTLLCAEGPVGCITEVRWAVEVRDAGAGPEGVEAVARVVGGADPSFGPGLVVPGDPTDPPGAGIVVRYHGSHGSARRLAEHLGTLLDARSGGPTRVRSDPMATSPVVVEVGPP